LVRLANETGVTFIGEKLEERAPPSLPDNIVIIGDAAMATGFKLAGVSEIYVADEKEGAARLVEVLDRENVGIVIVKDEIISHLDWRVKKRIESIAKPVVIAVPGKRGPLGEEGSLRELVKRALGFEMKG